MSITGDRAAIAAALNAVDGVSAHQYRPRTMPPGTAWPLLERLDNAMAGSFQATFRVVVILPTDEIAASKWFDAHHEVIADALLESFGIVDAIEPGLVQTDVGDLEAMMLTVRREA